MWIGTSCLFYHHCLHPSKKESQGLPAISVLSWDTHEPLHRSTLWPLWIKTLSLPFCHYTWWRILCLQLWFLTIHSILPSHPSYLTLFYKLPLPFYTRIDLLKVASNLRIVTVSGALAGLSSLDLFASFHAVKKLALLEFFLLLLFLAIHFADSSSFSDSFKHSFSFSSCLCFKWVYYYPQASLVAQMVKNPPAVQETQVWSQDGEDTTPVFLTGKSHEQRRLAGYSPWGCKESDTAVQLSMHTLSSTFIGKEIKDE